MFVKNNPFFHISVLHGPWLLIADDLTQPGFLNDADDFRCFTLPLPSYLFVAPPNDRMYLRPLMPTPMRVEFL